MAKDIKLGIIIDQSGNAAQKIGALQSGLGTLGGIAGGILTGGLVLAGAGVVALGAGLVSSVGAAMDAQTGQAQLAAVLKSTEGISGMTLESVNDLASGLQDVTAFEDDAILAGENMLLTFTNVGKEVFPAATETILDMAQALGGDTVSNAKILGKALNDPIEGISALSRAGVQFTDAQKDQIKAMVEAGDTAGAQKLILAELEKQLGGSAKAAGETLPGKLAILQHTFGDIQETIGAAFLPILSQVADLFTAGLHSDLVQGALATLTGFITETVVPGIENIAGAAGRIIAAFSEGGFAAVFQVFEDGSSRVSSLFEAMGFGEETSRKMADAIAWIGTKAGEVWAWIQGTAIPVLGDWANAYAMPALDTFINETLPFLWAKAQEVWAWIQDTAIPGLKDWGLAIEEFLAPKFADLKVILDAFFNDVLPPLQLAWEELFKVWEEDISPALADLGLAIGDLLETLGFSTEKTDFWKIALALLTGILAGVTEKVRAWTPAIKAGADGLVFMIGMVRTGIERFIKFKEGVEGIIGAVGRLIRKIRDFGSDLANLVIPDWLTPGSATPFEIGLRGIAGAAGSVAGALPQAFGGIGGPSLAGAGIAAGGQGSGGAGGIVVNFTYSPVISLADRFEAENVLAPFIASGVRVALAGGKH